jgi:hypothetical protein
MHKNPLQNPFKTHLFGISARTIQFHADLLTLFILLFKFSRLRYRITTFFQIFRHFSKNYILINLFFFLLSRPTASDAHPINHRLRLKITAPTRHHLCRRDYYKVGDEVKQKQKQKNNHYAYYIYYQLLLSNNDV